jgi:hypothetical protein
MSSDMVELTRVEKRIPSTAKTVAIVTTDKGMVPDDIALHVALEPVNALGRASGMRYQHSAAHCVIRYSYCNLARTCRRSNCTLYQCFPGSMSAISMKLSSELTVLIAMR